MTCITDMGSFKIKMVLSIRECGRIIKDMEWVRKLYLMAQNTTGCSRQELKKAKATIDGRMDLSIEESGDIMSFGVRVFIYGQMIGGMMASGLTLKCMVKVFNRG